MTENAVGSACDTPNGNIRLESSANTIPNYTDGVFELSFTHNIASEQSYDGDNLKYSTDLGDTWTIIPSSALLQTLTI